MNKSNPSFHHGKEDYPTRELRAERDEGVAAMRGDDPGWCDDRRRAYLGDRVREWREKLQDNQKVYMSMTGRDEFLRSLVDESAHKMLKTLRRFDSMLRAIDAPKGRITPEMIERAKEYPISDIVETKQGRAVCVFHEGAKNRNMDIRNGFAYCHKCGASGDAITVYRKVTGASFPEAVRVMSGA